MFKVHDGEEYTPETMEAIDDFLFERKMNALDADDAAAVAVIDGMRELLYEMMGE